MKSKHNICCEHYIYGSKKVPEQCRLLASQFYQNRSYKNHSVSAYCKKHGGMVGLISRWYWISEEEFLVVRVYES